MSSPVSIIIPCYKGAAYLTAALESALAQTHGNIEIVAVDDGSPDTSAEVVESFQRRDGRVRLVRHERNRGVSAAWNTGMAQSRGEFVLRLAQDDVLVPEAVASLLETFRTRPEADAVYASYRRLRPDGNLAEAPKPVAEETALFRTDNHIGLCVMIHRRIYDAGLRYDTGVRVAEDLDFFVRAYDAGFRFVQCRSLPLLLVREHDQSGSVTQRALQNLEAARILAAREKSWWRHWRIYEYRHGEAAYRYRSEQNWRAAQAVVLAALRHAPLSPALLKQLLLSVFRRRPRRLPTPGCARPAG